MTIARHITCVVVDDEPPALQLIADYVQRTPFLRLAGQTTDPMTAIDMVQQGMADLLFLDIQMPELTGLQLIKVIGHKCKTILTTAYPDYALDGYELDVIDYLLKPVTFDRFLVAVNKARERIIPPAPAIQSVQSSTPPSHIFVKTEYKIQKIDLADILYLEGLRDYVAIHTRNGKVLTQQSMKSFEAQLPEQNFIRVHKSYMIAIDKIRFIERNRIVIADSYIPVGEMYQEAVRGVINSR